MIELRTYLEQATAGNARHREVDWSVAPWRGAQPLLHWLGFAPEGQDPGEGEYLSAAETDVACQFLVQRFVDASGRLTWSSEMLESAVDAVARSVGRPPEAFLRGVWDLLAGSDLDADVYEFCRAVSSTLLVRSVQESDWDLVWVGDPGSPSQVCLRYWALVLKPSLFHGELEFETMAVLTKYPFSF